MSTTASPRRKMAYGVDLDAGHLVVVRAVRARGGIRTDIVAEGDSSMTRDLESGRAELSAALPAGSAFTRWLRTPFASRAKAVKVFPTLLDIQLPFPLEECAYTFLDTQSTPAAQVETLAVAARQEHIAQRLDELKAAGLEPERLDHEGLALWTQSVAERPVEADTLRLVAWVGHGHVTLALGQGERFLAARSLDVAAADLSGEPALRPFVQRVQQLVHSRATAESPTQCVWAGPAASPAIAERLGSALAHMDMTFATHKDPEAFLARALASRGLGEPGLPCNFRTAAFAHPRVSRRTERDRLTTATCALIAGLLLAGSSLGWKHALVTRKAQLQSRITRTACNITGMPPASVPTGLEVTAVERHLKTEAGRTTPFLQAFQPSLSHVLDTIFKTCSREGMTLDTLSLRHDLLSVSGLAKEAQGSARLADQLEEMGFDVQVEPSSTGTDEGVRFTIRGRRTT